MIKGHRKLAKFRPGDIYEDSAYHPCVCIDAKDGALWGISLIDGSYPRSCDIGVSGVRRLTPEEAWTIRLSGPADAGARRRISRDKRWWPAQRGPRLDV